MKKGIDVNIANLVDIKRPHLVELGNHVSIDSFFVCTTGLKVGNWVHISPHVGIIGGADGLLEMADHTFLSLGARIICGSDEFKGHGLICPFVPKEYSDKLIQNPIKIEKFAGICANSTVLPGCTISTGSIIGANSLVLANTITKPWTIYAGNPIRELSTRNSENMIKYADLLDLSKTL